MSGPYALGIDIGTSGVRAALLDSDQKVSDFKAVHLADFGRNLRSPRVWQLALAELMHQICVGRNAAKIEAVAVCGTSGTVLSLDSAGAPIGDALMYNDAVQDPAIAQAIAKVAPRESAAHGAASALARAIVLQQRSGTARIVHQADWIAEQLTDTHLSSDESNALKTGYDPIARKWPDWLAGTSLKLGLLPNVLPAGEHSGTLSGAYGLPKGAALVTGVTDGCASFLATGAAVPGDAVTVLGSTLTLKLLSDRPIFAPDFGIYSHRVGGMWLAGGASNTGGGVLAAYFSPDEISSLSMLIDPGTSTGLDYYPLISAGERFPYNNPVLPPRLTPRPKDDVFFLQAMLEGMARIEVEGYRRLVELGAPKPRSLRTVGGGARNPVWRALRLAALDMEEASTLSEEACVGVARLACAWLRR